MKANARAFLERISRNYAEDVDGIALFQTDTAVRNAQLKQMLGPLLPRLGDMEAVGDLLAAARKKQPQISESERHFGLDNHSLIPQLSGSPRLSLETI